MKLRFVTRTVHAYLDYPVALALIGLPFILGLGEANPIAKWLSVATGVAAFVLTLLTEHETGVIRVLPYPFHVAVDRLVGLVFVAAPVRARLWRAGCHLLLGLRRHRVDCHLPTQRASPAQPSTCRRLRPRA